MKNKKIKNRIRYTELRVHYKNFHKIEHDKFHPNTIAKLKNVPLEHPMGFETTSLCLSYYNKVVS